MRDSVSPDAAETHMALGYYYYFCLLDYDQALRHFKMALEKQPKNSRIIEGIGYVKRRQGKMVEAVTNLILASEIDPRAAVIAFNLAETYALMRRYQEAEQWYNRALILNPNYQRAYAWKIRMFLNWEGNTKKAHQVLEEASKFIDLDDNLIQYHYVLIDVFDGNYQEALKRISPGSSEAYEDQFYFVPKAQLLAQIHGLMKDSQQEKSYYDSARMLIEAKIKEDAEDSRLWSALGIAWAGLGQKKEAIRAAEKAVEILPVSKEAYRGTFRAKDLAQVDCMVGEYDKALNQIEYLLSIPGEISVASLKIDPVWIPLRPLPRFQKLLK
jgi:tetratricopeptide (TPR) repeat protein